MFLLDELGEFFYFSDAYLVAAIGFSDLFHAARDGVACCFCEVFELVEG
jgi:hypothetical protein